jgi:CRP-like cAMP-binding protein
MNSVRLNEDLLLRRSGMRAGDLDVAAKALMVSQLQRHELRELLADAVVREVERGTVLFIQGDDCDRFYFVLAGWVRLFRQTADGSEVTIALFTKGESLAEAAMLAGGRFPVSGVAADQSRLLVVPRSSFLRQIEANPALCRSLMASLSVRLHGFVKQIEQISYRSTVERLAAFLLRLTDVEQGPARITLPMDKTLVAARLGMQPESLSRSFAKLRRHGVETTGGDVHVRDVAVLRALVPDRDDELPD